METMEALLTRRSVRQFESKPISQEAIDRILQAAMNAPSAGNQQPWHFMVINQKKLLEAIMTFHPYSKMLEQAPLAIIPCADLSVMRHEPYWPQDLAAATENMLIAIRAEGLGGVWLGVYPDEARVEGARKTFSLPNSIIPFAIVAIGHTQVKQIEANRYQTHRVHYNGFNVTNG